MTEDDPMRELTRRLFARDDEQPEPEPAPTGNHAPREGNSPDPNPPDDMRVFVTSLFERAHNQH